MRPKPLVLGGADAGAAAPLFRATQPDVRVLGADDAAAELRALDDQGVVYTLVHVGPDDGHAGGSHERAHHRIALADAARLASRLQPRERPLVTCLAFAYKKGVPEDVTWLVDVRFLDNPYWVPELRDLSGRDAAVAEYVLGQPAATRLFNPGQVQTERCARSWCNRTARSLSEAISRTLTESHDMVWQG